MLWTATHDRWDGQPVPDPALDGGVMLPPGLGDPWAGPGGGDAMLTGVPVFMSLVLAVFVVIVLLNVVRAGQTFASNSAQPRQTVAARVVGKRAQTEGGAGESAVRTLYFATFEMTSGERVEVSVPRGDYGQLVEGDEGQLTHQGTWYRRFERRRVIPVDGTWEAPGGPSLPPPVTS